jgi:hypothetical protein
MTRRCPGLRTWAAALVLALGIAWTRVNSPPGRGWRTGAQLSAQLGAPLLEDSGAESSTVSEVARVSGVQRIRCSTGGGPAIPVCHDLPSQLAR